MPPQAPVIMAIIGAPVAVLPRTAALIAVLAMTMFSCRKKEDKPDPQEVADMVVAACDEIALDVVPAAQDAINEYIEAKEKDEAKKREKEKKKKEEEEKKKAEEKKSSSSARAS